MDLWHILQLFSYVLVLSFVSCYFPWVITSHAVIYSLSSVPCGLQEHSQPDMFVGRGAAIVLVWGGGHCCPALSVACGYRKPQQIGRIILIQLCMIDQHKLHRLIWSSYCHDIILFTFTGEEEKGISNYRGGTLPYLFSCIWLMNLITDILITAWHNLVHTQRKNKKGHETMGKEHRHFYSFVWLTSIMRHFNYHVT